MITLRLMNQSFALIALVVVVPGFLGQAK